MESLEKKMLFIPNRFFASRKDLYVSFNIAVIPADMTVTSMAVHIPLPALGTGATVHLHAIAAPWDEQSIRTVRPACSPAVNVMYVPAGTREARFAVEAMSHNWRFRSLENHGLYVRLDTGAPCAFSPVQPPYLLAGTV